MDDATRRQEIATLLERGELAEARRAAFAFMAARPDALAAYQGLGTLLEAEGDAQGAAECYRGFLPASVEREAFDVPDDADAAGSGRGVDWLDAHPAERTPVRSPSARELPLSAHAKDSLTAFATGTVVVEQGSLCHDTINTVVLDRDGRIVREAPIRNAGPVLDRYADKPPIRYAGDIVLLGVPGSMNYFHWMTDVLPRFAVLERSGIDWRDATFVLPMVVHPFQLETLAMLGVDPARIHETTRKGEHVSGDRLLIPYLQNMMGLSMGRWVSPFLRERFGGRKPARRDRRLLVSRDPEASHGRGLGNVVEITEFYTSMGYEIVIPDRFGVREQFELFGSASHVAGPHGAGFANLHFCAPGTAVFEFFGDHLAPCYWAMSELNGLDYLNCRGERTDPAEDGSLAAMRNVDARRSASFSVPLDTIRAMHARGERSSGAPRPDELAA